MPSSYSPNLRLELMATGENRSTWGQRANANVFSLVEQAISGYVAIDMDDDNITLTAEDGASDQARNMMLTLTGSNTAVRDVTVPDVSKLYVVRNAVSNDHAIRIVNTLSNVTIANGAVCLVWCDGVNLYASHDLVDDLEYVPVTRTLTAGSGIQTIGDLSANRTIAVDTSVIRTTGDQTLAGAKTFSSPPLLPDGSAGAPSVTFGSDTDTGLYRSGSNQIAFSVGGTAVATLTSSAFTLASGVSISFAGTGAATTRAALGLGSLSTVSPTGTANSSSYLRGDMTWATLPPSGVTSVGVAVPSGLTVSGTPVTSSGTISISYASGYRGFTDALASSIATSVQTSGNQTIGGTKTFTSTIDAASIDASGFVTAHYLRTTGGTISRTSSGTLYLRPNGYNSSTGQMYITNAGNVVINGTLTVTG